jgi:hypothetical protein
MAYSLDVTYYNSFWLKKVTKDPAIGPPVPATADWPGLPWNPTSYPTFPFTRTGAAPWVSADAADHWYIEESRIRGGYNNQIVDLGVRAYTSSKNPQQRTRGNALIYSGLYNSRTSVNNTNAFPSGEDITRSLDPRFGDIQKLYAEDTNLIIFQEYKVSRSLIDKDNIYTTEGGTQTQMSGVVIGQNVPYVGEYGISKNPESFAIHGYRKYFVDKNKGFILRLSRDGITEISSYGMRDYFRDTLASIPDGKQIEYTPTVAGVVGSYTASNWGSDFVTITANPCCVVEPGMYLQVELGGIWYTITGPQDMNLWVIYVTDNGDGTCEIKFNQEQINPVGAFVVGANVRFFKYFNSQVAGGFDTHNQSYVVSMQERRSDVILGSDASNVYSTLSFDEEAKGWTSFYDYKPRFLGSLQNNFYTFFGESLYKHYIDPVVFPNTRCNFYGVQNNASITFVFNPNPSINKNFNTISYEGSSGWKADYYQGDIEGVNTIDGGATWIDNQDVINSVMSYTEGQYDSNTPVPNYGLLATVQPIFHAGFDRKGNKYVANLVSRSTVRPGEVVFWDGNVNVANPISGIKGYYATVKMETDQDTQLGGRKELYAVSSNWVVSST